MLTVTLFMGLEKRSINELQIGEDAAIVVDLLLPEGEQKNCCHESEHQEGCACNIDMLPVDTVQQQANRTTAADKVHCTMGKKHSKEEGRGKCCD